jgi:UDP-N-acetylmuramate--L-alanine ligase
MIHLDSNQVSSLLENATPGAAVYLIGAGGCGVSGLGHLLLDLGFHVFGSDVIANQETHELQQRGARIHQGHAAQQLEEAVPILVVYSSAVRLNNPELRAAEQRQIPIVRRAVLLAALVRRQHGICVAGMHGKTTTTALLAVALQNLSANPSYAVGAHVPQLQRHARLAARRRQAGGPPWFVVETDESDGTLREFHPRHAIILNVDEEHLDYYANLDAVCREFANFGGQTQGRLVFCADDARLADLFARRPDSVSYGLNALASYRAVPARPADLTAMLNSGSRERPAEPLTAFEVWHGGCKLGDFTIQLAGEKNVSNATAVIALLSELGYTAAEMARAISDFKGAARRQQELFRDARFRVFDDYGHHPAEIQAVLKAFKSLASRRLLVAFQPHRYTRTHRLLDQFAASFKEADRLWITEVYGANEAEIAGVNGARLAESIRAQGQPADFVGSLSDLRRSVRAAMLPGDLVLFLGAGDITRAAHELAAELREESGHPPKPVRRIDDSVVAQLGRETRRAAGETHHFARRRQGRLYVEPASEEDLGALQFCAKHQLRFTMLGRGSNLLIRDGGVRGVVICLSHSNFSRLEIEGGKIRCGAE